MADPPAGAQSPGPCDDENLPAALEVEPGNTTVAKESSGLLDPTPRSDCMAIFKRNHQQSPFLRLSGEIRNMIYGYVFNNININIRIVQMAKLWCWTRPGIRQGKRKYLDLLGSCRTIYAETRLLPFAGVVLEYDHQPVDDRYSTSISILPIQRDAISKLVIFHEDMNFEDDNDFAFAFLDQHAKSLRGLKQIIVNVFDTYKIDDGSTLNDEVRKIGEVAVGLVRKVMGDSFQIQYRSY